PAKLLPALMPASHCLLVATPAPIGAPPARTPARSTSCMTSAEPESGADDAEALSAGRWDHLSCLPESPTRAEVTETSRCDATPRHPPRQTVQRVRAGAAQGEASVEPGTIEMHGSALERNQGRLPPRRARRCEHLRSTLSRIAVAIHEN